MITGGAGAGKTLYALSLAAERSVKIYIATAVSTDAEMEAKITAHKSERDETYTTVEEPIELAHALHGADADVVIIDCITFWVNNLTYYKKDPDKYFSELIKELSKTDKPVILVTNEVGLGIIPWDKETRLYAKLLSRINRQLADVADNVIMMVSGIPVSIK